MIIVRTIFYLIMVAFALYSILPIYALVSFGRSKSLAALVTAIYLVISTSLYAIAMTTLNNL